MTAPDLSVLQYCLEVFCVLMLAGIAACLFTD